MDPRERFRAFEEISLAEYIHLSGVAGHRCGQVNRHTHEHERVLTANQEHSLRGSDWQEEGGNMSC